MARVYMDTIYKGEAYGSAADLLMANNCDVRPLRPFIAQDGRHYVDVTTNKTDKDGKPLVVTRRLTENRATLRRDDWVRFDNVLVKARRLRLKAYADLRAANTYGGFDGYSTPMLENELVDDTGEAFVDFDGLSEGRGSAASFIREGLPLPIIHSPFHFSGRVLAASRKRGTPLSTTQAEMATRRVMEVVEKMTIGTLLVRSFNPTDYADYRRPPRIYGYANHPDNVDVTITSPVVGGWTPKTLVTEVNQAISSLQDNGFDGPFMVYYDKKWTPYLNGDYSDAKGDNTLKDRMKEIDDVTDVRKLNFMGSDYRILIVQMTEDVCRAVNGMEFSMIQWDTKGGEQKNFRVMGIQVPQVRSDTEGRCGIANLTV